MTGDSLSFDACTTVCRVVTRTTMHDQWGRGYVFLVGEWKRRLRQEHVGMVRMLAGESECTKFE